MKEEKKLSIPVFRQVQILAGVFIVLSILGGYFISSSFYLFTLFVGVMLIFAGVTGICFASMVLEKMPWNRQ